MRPNLVIKFKFQVMAFLARKKDTQQISVIVRREEEDKAKDLAKVSNFPYVNLLTSPIGMEALALAEEQEIKEGMFVPFQRSERIVAIAATDPKNNLLPKFIEKMERNEMKVNLFICSKTSLLRGFEEYKKIPPKIKEISGKIEISAKHLKEVQGKVKNFANLDEEIKKDQKRGSTWVIETILGGSLAFDASDIHIIPEEDFIRIQFRLDGLMHDVSRLEIPNYSSFLSRTKLLANLKINVHDIAQDGRFTISAFGKEIEVRVSVVPGEYNENIVMRVLNPNMILSLDQLGLHSWHEAVLLEEMKRPNGMILTTGPTGSGKTTTLYACLKKIAAPEIKVITIEDPIEYHLDGIVQTQVETAKGYSFANGLRAVMRQDPDVILVGEIRDGDTANTAIQAALTGHFVFSTLHTNDAAGIIPRLVELGINPATIPPALNLGIAQRLLRRLCPKCKKEDSPPPYIFSKIEKKLVSVVNKIPDDSVREKYNLEDIKIFKAVGCSACNMEGYKKRIGIFEILQLTGRIEQMILNTPSISEMKKTAIEEGMITMQEDGLLRVMEGVTTIDELTRISGPIE